MSDKNYPPHPYSYDWASYTTQGGLCDGVGPAAPVKPEPPVTSISNCEFYGVKWDVDAMGTVALLAQALVANADAIMANADAVSSIADMFKAGNVNIEAMVKFDTGN
jgi:hypothetical protein